MNSSSKTIKDIATDFLRLAASGKVQEAYRYTADDFLHHNPYFKGDKQSLMKGMEDSAVKNPNKVFEIQRALQEGDFIAVHSRVVQSPNNVEIAVVHIFRFHNGRIAELWDIAQIAPPQIINENGMF